MKKLNIVLMMAAGLALGSGNLFGDTVITNAWLTQPLSLVNCLNIAAQQNATILRAKSDLEASYGVVVQTRAVALPHVTASGQYKKTDPHDIEGFGGPGAILPPDQNWNSGIQILQDIYDGGKMIVALRAARATK